MIGRIVNDPARPGNRFEGYAAANQNENKILRDVFEKGDAWFRTGDLMRKDERGYFYFVDRIGDTFRWKGENVSTSEVAEAINTFPGIADANVYGVTVVGRDGRAGMAAIVCDGQCDLGALHAHLAAQPAGLRAAAVPAHPAQDRRHRHVQAEEGRSGARGLQSGGDQRSDLFQRSAGQGLRAARPGALPADRERRRAAVIASPESVLAFWREAGPEKWFTKDTAFDDAIRARFLETYEAAAAGKLSDWEQTAEGALALVIVLDQFPRNMFRGDARTFAADPLARAVADARARARLRPAGAARRNGSSSICRSSIPSRWPTRSDAARCLPRPATRTF